MKKIVFLLFLVSSLIIDISEAGYDDETTFENNKITDGASIRDIKINDGDFDKNVKVKIKIQVIKKFIDPSEIFSMDKFFHTFCH